MGRQIINRLRNVKEWLELHNMPLLSRFSTQRVFARYSMHDESVADLWESDPDALYVEPLIVTNSVVVDVGANLGTFCYAVRRAQQSARLVAFEPIPALAKRLRKAFKDIVVLEVALSDSRSVATFRIPYIDGRRCNTRASLAPIVDSSAYSEIRVQTDLFDTVFTEIGLERLDFVKVDVEGHELEVIRGGEQTLRKHQPILLIEIEQRHHDNVPIRDIATFIENLGYKGHFLNRRSLKFDPIEALDVRVHQRREDMGTHRYINNFLFLSRAANIDGLLTRLTSHLLTVLTSRRAAVK